MNNSEIEETIKNIQSLNTPEERVAFIKYARQVPSGGNILDIGTCAGGSAFVFALASKDDVHVYTVDPVKNPFFIENKEKFGLDKKITFFQKTSEELAKGWDTPIDLIFIDGIHSYAGVMNDFMWFREYVKKDGIVIFHDYYLYKDAIDKAVDELEESGEIEKLEIIDSLYKGEVRTGMYVSRIK